MIFTKFKKNAASDKNINIFSNCINKDYFTWTKL